MSALLTQMGRRELSRRLQADDSLPRKQRREDGRRYERVLSRLGAYGEVRYPSALGWRDPSIPRALSSLPISADLYQKSATRSELHADTRLTR